MAETGRYYTYLISSLPMLTLGSKPPLSFEKFLSLCENLIPKNEVEELRNSGTALSCCKGTFNNTLCKWRSFERTLRNELVKIRAARLKLDPSKYLREDGCGDIVCITHIALAAHRKPSLIESERFLDSERWNYLESLSAGHYFDFDFLVIYAQKLLIAEKWGVIAQADPQKIVSGILEPVETI
ncbi:MAG: DUF2764 family protein [Candidatus Omnitrophica bacterium]|nr:DUF2764 family protein [Candidatus Omnitrophota bacterium]